jgi:type I restriction enzyme R subunit
VSSYNIVVSTEENTVVAEYIPNGIRSDKYQSEAELEREFINILSSQGYEYIKINDEAALIANLRRQLEALNSYTFSDGEWKRFFAKSIAASDEGITEKSRRIQEDHIQNLIRDSGETKNIYLIDKQNIHNNRLQVINQYEQPGGAHAARYDVTILVNGMPLIHIELKRRGVAIREAFNQIKRYGRDSFWAACGLYEYVQIFIISNGTHTKYYSNTTREQHIKEGEGRSRKKTSNSFEFTNYWADANNKAIPDLVDFTKTFLVRHTILNILTRYCVFTAEDMLLVMRPYQIAATERILSRIAVSTNYKKTGTIEAGGFIWHTTGSGKTLTSFKTARLASRLEGIDKVLFVVDRKDLDYQTMKEYDRFEKGAANGNTSTRILQKHLENPSSRILITTIQKLSVFISKNKGHEVFKKHIVLIFDECHRSQFGEMHVKIVKMFKNYHILGFTGTPISSKNAGKGKHLNLRTTEQAFGKQLHSYTIVNAINDGNVLPFRIDTINTMKIKGDKPDTQVHAIDTKKAMEAAERIAYIVSYVLEHFDQKTKRSEYYSLKGKRMAGFNSIFAASSIPMAMKYYTEFKRQLAESGRKLSMAIIYSFCPNEEDPEDFLPDESFDTNSLDKSSRDLLDSAISDYNKEFSVNFDTSSDKFENYYKDLSQRLKNREVDMLIVVNMFLTGFDATTLNTLWVDKNLRMHGLIQAFSRTNRILNSVKNFGNIVCFRNLQEETDEAIALFGNEDAGGIVLLKAYKDYYEGYDDEQGEHRQGYSELIADLKDRFPLSEQIIGESNKKYFIKLFGAILRIKNILTAFDEFAGNEILSEREFQNYNSRYLDLYYELRKGKAEKENINDDIVFEIELVRQIEVNIDYILMMVEKYYASHRKDSTIRLAIFNAIDSSMQLRSKKKLIESFLERVNITVKTGLSDSWREFVLEEKEKDLAEIIADENLKEEETRKFIENSFRDGVLKTTGTDIDRILPPISRFSGGNQRAIKQEGVIAKLLEFFERYFGV